jgi:hypothetical protein
MVALLGLRIPINGGTFSVTWRHFLISVKAFSVLFFQDRFGVELSKRLGLCHFRLSDSSSMHIHTFLLIKVFFSLSLSLSLFIYLFFPKKKVRRGEKVIPLNTQA